MNKIIIIWVISIIIIILISSITLLIYLNDQNSSNYYEPMVFKSINLDSINTEYTAEYLNRYKGKYAVSIAVDNPPPAARSYEYESLNLIVEISAENKIFLKEYIKRGLYPFRDIQRQIGGLVIVRYKVPEDVPRDKLVIIKLIISGDNSSFTKNYGGQKLLVKKISDE